MKIIKVRSVDSQYVETDEGFYLRENELASPHWSIWDKNLKKFVEVIDSDKLDQMDDLYEKFVWEED